MELLAPDNLPGVGMGDLQSLAAVCGLLGLAATSGVLVAEGMLGTVLFVVSAAALLAQKPDLGGSPLVAGGICAVLLLLALVRRALQVRGRNRSRALAGLAPDSDTGRAGRATVRGLETRARWCAIGAVLIAGASVGVAWAEWNDMPISISDLEAVIGLVLGLVAGAIGGDAAWRFIDGAVRAGGSAAIIGIVMCIVAYVLNVASVYVPFTGLVVFVLALVLAARLRRRQQHKYEGLRILS